jgi:hypothetical protein
LIKGLACPNEYNVAKQIIGNKISTFFKIFIEV